MSSSLRDDLASLRIERRGAPTAATPAASPSSPSSPPNREVRVQRDRGMRVLSLLIWLIPLLLLAGGGYAVYRQYDQLKPKLEVSVGLVQAMTVGEAETLLSAKGYLRSHSQAEIGAKIPGRVEAMLVEEGSRVKKGDVLAVLEHNDLKAQLLSREAMLQRTQAELNQAEADLQLKELRARRRTQLQSRGTVTGEEMEQVLADRDMAAAQVQALKASLKVQEAMVQETRQLIDDMSIRAPFDGTVTKKGAELGETILLGGMGAASGRGSVATLADLDHLEVETDITETYLSRIVVGQPAEIAVSAVPGRHYRGRLDRIIPMGDRTRGTIKVMVEVLDPDEHLFPELVATVHFLPDKAVNNPNAGKTFLFAPKAALVEENGFMHAWVVGPQGIITRRQVEVVESSDDLARVDKGLSAGESVILNPPKNLSDGLQVKIAD
jgi:RND family efflux transporter MFP subunit